MRIKMENREEKAKTVDDESEKNARMIQDMESR
jgi:hypothetical protein